MHFMRAYLSETHMYLYEYISLFIKMHTFLISKTLALFPSRKEPLRWSSLTAGGGGGDFFENGTTFSNAPGGKKQIN